MISPLLTVLTILLITIIIPTSSLTPKMPQELKTSHNSDEQCSSTTFELNNNAFDNTQSLKRQSTCSGGRTCPTGQRCCDGSNPYCCINGSNFCCGTNRLTAACCTPTARCCTGSDQNFCCSSDRICCEFGCCFNDSVCCDDGCCKNTAFCVPTDRPFKLLNRTHTAACCIASNDKVCDVYVLPNNVSAGVYSRCCKNYQSCCGKFVCCEPGEKCCEDNACCKSNEACCGGVCNTADFWSCCNNGNWQSGLSCPPAVAFLVIGILIAICCCCIVICCWWKRRRPAIDVDQTRLYDPEEELAVPKEDYLAQKERLEELERQNAMLAEKIATTPAPPLEPHNLQPMELIFAGGSMIQERSILAPPYMNMGDVITSFCQQQNMARLQYAFYTRLGGLDSKAYVNETKTAHENGFINGTRILIEKAPDNKLWKKRDFDNDNDHDSWDS